MSTSLLHSRVHQYAIAKVYVFSDSVLCLGRMGDDPKIKWYSETNFVSELNRIDGKPMEFEWKILPGFETRVVRIRWANYSVIQWISKTGSSPCQCSTTLNWKQEEMKKYAKRIRKVLQNTLDNFLAVIGFFLGPGPEKKWYGT